MKQFEYDITLYPAALFQQVAYFCSEEGLCNLEEVPADQVKRLEEILSDRGREGWELVQLSFGRGGLMAFWKRERTD
ncbi:MAG: hypothetical protein AB1641_31025 [Thermodesulfobacteriota bacterium]